MTDQERIADLERQLAEQTRRAEVAEAWQKRLTAILAKYGRIRIEDHAGALALSSHHSAPIENTGE